jgi:hypothetical protein
MTSKKEATRKVATFLLQEALVSNFFFIDFTSELINFLSQRCES